MIGHFSEAYRSDEIVEGVNLKQSNLPLGKNMVVLVSEVSSKF